MSRLFLAVALLSFLIAVTGFIDVMEIGFVNGTNERLTLLLQYDNGRKIDYTLEPHETLANRHLFGEKLLRVVVSSGKRMTRTCDLQQLSENHDKSDRWLYITAESCRLISDRERKLLIGMEKARKE